MIKYIKELFLSKSFRLKVKKLPVIRVIDESESEKNWISIRNKIRSLIINNRIKTFYDWDILKYYFIVGDNDYIKVEVESIRQSPGFLRYASALQDTNYIKLHNSQYFFGSNPNRIHHAYHIQQFEDSTSLNINDFDFIFEFGGGYGNLCHYVRSLGYKGKYVIFDCPELILLQEYYLKNSGLKFKMMSKKLRSMKNNVNYGVSEINILNDLSVNFNRGLFIGTWSISETSLSFREEFLNNIFIK